MSLDPHNLLADVHPDLVKVITTASQSPQPFEVIQGLRTLSEEQQAVATGHSQTMHSRHLPDPNYGGKACAVDVAAIFGGHISWSIPLYMQIADQIEAAADDLKVPITWGGDWVTLKDYGHFELSWEAYP